jgi:hypothetical protein
MCNGYGMGTYRTEQEIRDAEASEFGLCVDVMNDDFRLYFLIDAVAENKCFIGFGTSDGTYTLLYRFLHQILVVIHVGIKIDRISKVRLFK